MPVISRTHFALKALQELGLIQTTNYVRYQVGLRSGYYKYATKRAVRKVQSQPATFKLNSSITIPDSKTLSNLLGSEGVTKLLTEADEITSGKVRLFGGPPIPLDLIPVGPLSHWTEYESGKINHWNEDIKWVWEPGRFGWAITLGRAYSLSSMEKYTQAFWQYFESFQSANPPNMGPHWVSAQEVALRLMAYVFAAHVFADSPNSTKTRKTKLARAIAMHAARIPPTIAYAQAQNNNHLLSEAAGLFTAGQTLRDHPQASQWSKLGLYWFNIGIQTQISLDGTYVQHSTNYHRLMLQLALWVRNLTRFDANNSAQIPDKNNPYILPKSSLLRLADATQWLLALLDPETGQVPNLGPNDGAYIFPFSICPSNDYRPVLQSACLAFHGDKVFQSGPWDEMAFWYGIMDTNDAKRKNTRDDFTSKISYPPATTSPHILRKEKSWAYMRVAEFVSRPGHADQLHVDLWWRGINIAQDAGTYLYNAPLPWNNSLTRTSVHNTITIDGANQMTYAGRFLWLDWAQATIIDYDECADGSYNRLVAHHDGYRHINLSHLRTIEHLNEGWKISDDILPLNSNNIKASLPQQGGVVHNIELHWLLPDWPWEIEENRNDSTLVLRLLSPHGWIKLEIESSKRETVENNINKLTLQIYRKGKTVYGMDQENPILGWVSPTYGYKYPALSIRATTFSPTPLTLVSKWYFPH